MTEIATRRSAVSFWSPKHDQNTFRRIHRTTTQIQT